MTQLQANESKNTAPAGLNPRWTRIAAGITAGSALGVIIAMTWTALSHPLAGGLVATASIWLLAAVGTMVSARYLWLGCSWAQQTLLGLWAAVTITAVGYLLMGFVFAEAAWWSLHPAARGVGMPLAGLSLLAGAATIAMLVAATSRNTRARYGSMVAGVVTATLALVIAVNVIAQRDYVRKSFETFGLYRLTPRNRQIIDNIDQPVRLTCLYSDNDKTNALYGQRTFELLREMATYGQGQDLDIQAANGNSTSGRTKVVNRLKARFSSEAAPQIALLRQTAAQSKTIIDELNAEADRWQTLPADAYLNLWNARDNIAPPLRQTAEQTGTLRRELGRQLAPNVGIDAQSNTLPNYGQLMAGTTDFLKQTRQAVAGLAHRLSQYQAIPGAITERRDGITGEIDRLTTSQSGLLSIVGGPDDPAPADLRGTLQDFTRQAASVSQYANLLATRLDDVAGPELTILVKRSRPWVRESESLDGTILRNDLPGLLRRTAERYDTIAYQIESTLPTSDDASLANRLALLRREALVLDSILTQLSQNTQDTLDLLTTVDPTSKAIFAKTQTGQWMRGTINVIDSILDRADALPPLQDESILPDLAQENIVLIEIGDDQLTVVPFEVVWPVASGGYSTSADTDQPQRVFNGNGALGSTLLRLTERPFATVVVVYYASTDQMQSQVDPRALFQVYRTLGASNFRVRLWNLAEEGPDLRTNAAGQTVDSTGTPVVILVLPPAIATLNGANMNASHRQSVTSLIDKGTPAIFLASYLWPEPVRLPQGEPALADIMYRWDDYLINEWGIDAQTNKLILPVLPDLESPGRFLLDYRRLTHLPLSLFSKHAIGEPLTGQRMLWTYLCPVRPATYVPTDVTLTPLLTVPGQWDKSIWVTNRGRAMIEEALYAPQTTTFTADFVSHEEPLSSEGIPVALAATRTRGPRTGRLVVLGVGKGLIDRHLSLPPKHTDSRGREVTEPLPHANTDLLINSVYWAIGQDDYIAAGPARAKPIGDLSRGARSILWVVCVLVLPAGVLVGGAVVMVARRR
jgi:hypothetical protein